MTKPDEKGEHNQREKEVRMEEDTTNPPASTVEMETANGIDQESEDIIDLNASQETIPTQEDLDETLTQVDTNRPETRDETRDLPRPIDKPPLDTPTTSKRGDTTRKIIVTTTAQDQKPQKTRSSSPSPQIQTPTEQDRYHLRNTQPQKYKEINEGKQETEPKTNKKGKTPKMRKGEDTNDQDKQENHTNTPTYQTPGADDRERKELLKEAKEQLKATQKILTEERKKTKAWKEDKIRLEKEIATLRKALNTTNEELGKTERQLNDEKAKGNDTKNETDAAKRKMKETETENKKLKEEIDNMAIEMEEIKREMEEAKNNTPKPDNQLNQEIKRLKEELKEAKSENTTLKEDNHDLRMMVQENKEETNILMLRNRELRKTVQQSSDQKEKEKDQTKYNVLLIADSNRRYISPHLNSDIANWTIPNNIYTVEELEKKLDSEQTKDDIKKAHRVVLMLGTNDIKNDTMEPEEAAKLIIKQAKTIRDKRNRPVTIITPPPMNLKKCPETGVNIAIMASELIETSEEQITILDTLCGNLDEYPKQKILQADGYHLNDTGAKLIADQLTHHIEDNKAKDINSTGPKPTNKKNSIHIPEPTIGHIIGKGGRTINTIAETYEVEISLKEKKEDRDGGKTTVQKLE